MLGTSVLLAVREIRRHLLRSFLTTLGIIIGVASVVTMVTLGNGATAAVTEQISSLGSNMLTLRPGQGFGRGGGGPAPRSFEESDMAAIRSQLAGVKFIAPQVSTPVTAVYEGQNWSTTALGTTNDYLGASDITIAQGRPFSDAELAAGKSVCLLGDTVRSNLLRNVDPLGRQVRLKDISCQVIGVLERRGQGGFGPDQDDQVIMPVNTVMRRLTGNRDIQALQIAVDDAYDTKAVSQTLAALMRERRQLQPSDEDDFSIFDSKQISDTLQSTTRLLTALLAAVATVSLIVGGIGIMNIMLVSVTERTREIGIRLAIGAVRREVLMQFLIEAVALSCLGGVLGLLLALAATLSLAQLAGMPFIFSWGVNLLAFAFSAIIGVIFGYFPARRAAALNPIDALRHE